MNSKGWGNLRINFHRLLIAIFCLQISSSFAVATPVNPTYNNIPAVSATTANSFGFQNNPDLKNSNFRELSQMADANTSDPFASLLVATGQPTPYADSENVVIIEDFTPYTDDSTQTISVSATNGQIVNSYNSLDAATYNVVLTGDNTGQIGLFNSIYNAGSINITGTDISFADGEIHNYSLNNLTIGENVKFHIDADLANAKADSVSATGGTGTVYVSSLNFISGTSENSVKLQVIKSPTLTLNIDELKLKHVTKVQSTMYNDSILADSINFGITSFNNDSIVINGWKDVLYEMVHDTDKTHMLKNFIFRTTSEYKLTKDLGSLAQESILSISNQSINKYGVIDANGHSMFNLNNPISKVTLDHIMIKNAVETGNGSVARLDNNTAIFEAKDSVITNNKSDGNGGAFYVKNGTLKITNTTVSNNTSGGQGGAIYTEGNVDISADNGTTTFENNTANGENNGIYVGSKRGVITFNAKNNGVINMNDKIDGTQDGYLVSVNGDKTGNVKINNTMSNATIRLNSGVLTPSLESNFDNNNFEGYGGLLNLANNNIGAVHFNQVSIIGNTNLAIDADLRNGVADRISTNIYNATNTKLNISSINIMSDSIPTRITVAFAEGAIKDAIKNSVGTAYSAIYRYKVKYNKSDGKLIFDRGDGGGGGGGGGGDDPGGGGGGSGGGGGGGHNTLSADDFNPTILAAGIAQQLAYTNQLQNYVSAMYHSDAYMMLPKIDKNIGNRISALYNPNNIESDFVNIAYRNPIQDEIKSIWVRPYSNFESIGLKNGPKVSNIAYGMIFGGDSDLIKLRNGFNYVYGGYVGYNGNSANYRGMDINQQGAVVGLTANLYKGGFFNTITANFGWMMNETNTWYGNDSMNLMTSGVADRIGYNIEVNKGKFIIQPSIFFGYTFVYASDYTTSNGVDIQSDPLNVIHFAPTIKLIGNLAKGWQPYGVVSVMANFMDKTNFTANTIELPQMSIDPYVEYGLGIQRRWNENCQAFGQATVRNGGRNGVAVLLGMKCKVGKGKLIPTVVPKDNIPTKKVRFKTRKDPQIEIVDWRTAKQHEDEYGTPFKIKTSFLDKFKSLKKFIKFRYNTDVSAKVVSDVYSDGVIITSLKGQGKSGEFSTFVDVDLQRKSDTKEIIKADNFVSEGVIIIEDKAFNHTQTNAPQQVAPAKPIEKPVSNITSSPKQDVDTTVVETNITKPVKKTDFIKRFNKRFSRILRVNQTNYYKPERKYEFKDYKLELIKF